MSSTWWGNVDLSYKFAIVLGGAIIATFAAGFLKLWIQTRWTARMQLKEDMEKANKTTEKVGIKKELGVGDLFGVRAIEKGFYGGVSQVDLSATSSRKMQTPESAISLLDERGSPNHGKTDSIISSFNQPEGFRSGQSTPEPSNSARKNPSLRLPLSQADLIRSSSYDQVDMDNSLPPSPLQSNPPDPFEHNQLAMPGRAYDPQPAVRRDSHKASQPNPIITTTNTENSTETLKSPTLNLFPSASQGGIPRRTVPQPALPTTLPSKARTISEDSTQSHLNPQAASSTRSTTPDNGPAPAIHLRTTSSYSTWGDAIIDSYLDRRDSRYSVRMSGNGAHMHVPQHAPIQTIIESRSPSVSPHRPAERHTRNKSSQNSRSRSSSAGRKISRTMDSVRMSQRGRRPSATAANDRQRDVLHYEPSTGRTRAGSLQGRPVNFDAPRNSPFSDAHKSHSIKTSVDSTNSDDSKYTTDSGSTEFYNDHSHNRREDDDDDDEDELERANERKISQWKARELRRAIKSARANGTLDDSSNLGAVAKTPTGAQAAYHDMPPKARGPLLSVQPSGRPVLPPLNLGLDDEDGRREELKMTPSPMELVKRWQAEEEGKGKGKGVEQAILSPEARNKVVMDGILKRAEARN